MAAKTKNMVNRTLHTLVGHTRGIKEVTVCPKCYSKNLAEKVYVVATDPFSCEVSGICSDCDETFRVKSELEYVLSANTKKGE